VSSSVVCVLHVIAHANAVHFSYLSCILADSVSKRFHLLPLFLCSLFSPPSSESVAPPRLLSPLLSLARDDAGEESGLLLCIVVLGLV
jgi:hypothetical protein